MFEELHEIERHYEELAHRLTMPEAVQDPAAYGKLTREYKELEPLIEAFHRYRDVCRELDEMQQLMQDGSPDAEFKAMLQQEIYHYEKIYPRNTRNPNSFLVFV